MSARFKRLLPWLLSLLIVGWLFRSVDLGKVLDALVRADLATLLAWVVVFAGVVFVADSATLHVLFRRVLTPVAFRDVLAVKAVSYFLNAINYTAGAGAIAYFVHKRERVPFLPSLSTLLWLNFIDVVALLLLMTAGATVGLDLLPPALAARVPYVVAVGWAIVVGALVYWRAGVDFLVLGRLRDWRIFHAFRRATLADTAVVVGARTAFIALYVVMAALTLPTFGVHIPFDALLVYVPVLTFVQIVPASVSGLGAVQAVMIALYAPYAGGAEEPILAYSTVIGPAMMLLRVGLGYLWLRQVAEDLVAVDEAQLAAARAAEEGMSPEPAQPGPGSGSAGGAP